jgi:hypothetical protein
VTSTLPSVMPEWTVISMNPRDRLSSRAD